MFNKSVHDCEAVRGEHQCEEAPSNGTVFFSLAVFPIGGAILVEGANVGRLTYRRLRSKA